jgi:hypothetical protein
MLTWEDRYIVTEYVDWISVSGGIVQTLIYLDYSQSLWSPISGRIGVALSSTSAQEEQVLIDDAQEKGFSVPEKTLPETDITEKCEETVLPSVGTESTPE